MKVKFGKPQMIIVQSIKVNYNLMQLGGQSANLEMRMRKTFEVDYAKQIRSR